MGDRRDGRRPETVEQPGGECLARGAVDFGGHTAAPATWHSMLRKNAIFA
jgi:hypothetical protein